MIFGGKSDLSEKTWISLLGLLAPHEFFVTVDHSSMWRRHLSWAKESGSDLRTHLTQRFASNMVFMSLILGAEIGVLFNSSHPANAMREHMRESNYLEIEFWIGIMICVSVILTIFTLVATFTAWGMVSSVSDNNAHCLLRSSIGQYVTQLPSRLVASAIYSFLTWLVMFLFVLLPGMFSNILLVVVMCLFFHIVVVFSSFGRLIIHTGAMGSKRIFDPEFEKALLPSGLHTSLLIKAMDTRRKRKSATAQYRSLSQKKEVPHQQRARGPLEDSLPLEESELIKQTSDAFSQGANGPSGSLMEDSVETDAMIEKHEALGAGLPSPPSLESSLGSPQFPRPSVLNKRNMTLQSIKHVVNTTLSAPYNRKPAELASNGTDRIIEGTVGTVEGVTGQRRAGVVANEGENRRGIFRRISNRMRRNEWKRDEDTRSIYNAPPPAALDDVDDEIEENEQWRYMNGTRYPRPSVLNRANHNLQSVERITTFPEINSPPRFEKVEKRNKLSSVSSLGSVPEERLEGDDGILEQGESWHACAEDENNLEKPISSLPITGTVTENTRSLGDEEQHLPMDANRGSSSTIVTNDSELSAPSPSGVEGGHQHSSLGSSTAKVFKSKVDSVRHVVFRTPSWEGAEQKNVEKPPSSVSDTKNVSSDVIGDEKQHLLVNTEPHRNSYSTGDTYVDKRDKTSDVENQRHQTSLSSSTAKMFKSSLDSVRQVFRTPSGECSDTSDHKGSSHILGH